MTGGSRRLRVHTPGRIKLPGDLTLLPSRDGQTRTARRRGAADVRKHKPGLILNFKKQLSDSVILKKTRQDKQNSTETLEVTK